MKIAGMMLAVALLAPAALAAQGPPGGGPGRGMMMRSPIAIAVAHKADLTLTDDQVTKLNALETALQAKNAPLVKQMQDARQGFDFQNATDEQRQQMREKMMPIMQQLRTNRDAAQADAEKLLKPEQVTKLHDILQQEMPRRGPGGPPPQPQGK